MNINYAFLQDELAVLEIRKHQWLQSEQSKREIGFASAALDWIKKYGDDWRISRMSQTQKQDLLAEKRLFRRFDYRIPLQITTEDGSVASYTNNFNLIGLSCTIPNAVDEKSKVKVCINFAANKRNGQFYFESIISKIHRTHKTSNLCYDVFLPFTEDVRDFLRTNIQDLQPILN